MMNSVSTDPAPRAGLNGHHLGVDGEATRGVTS
jgi:hypothetical protein